MYDLNNVLKKCDKNSMIKGILKYTDNIPCSTSDINDSNSNKYNVMKYYEGTISEAEHKNMNDDLNIKKIYEKYIFNSNNILNTDDLKIDEDDIDSLIYLRMILDENSKYFEKLDKLMLRIYFENKKPELAGLVQKIYENEKYAWAKEYINKYINNNQNQNDNELSLIFRENTSDEYKKKFGITDKSETSVDNSKDKKICAEDNHNKSNSNWILEKFGGWNDGEKTGVDY